MSHAPLAVSLGTLPQWLTVAAVIAVALALRGGQLGPALGYLRDTNRTLHEQNIALQSKLEGATRRIGDLERKTDLSPLQSALLDAFKAHEMRDQERFEKTAKILDLIAERLGPESNGGGR